MRRVLVVDDDRDIARALRVRLRAAGYDVLVARDARRGFRCLQLHRPDVVLLDISMPGGTGFDLAEKIREEQRRELRKLTRLPEIIFMTASRVFTLRQQARELGSFAFIEKPYDPAVLIDTIEAALQVRARESAPTGGLRAGGRG